MWGIQIIILLLPNTLPLLCFNDFIFFFSDKCEHDKGKSYYYSILCAYSSFVGFIDTGFQFSMITSFNSNVHRPLHHFFCHAVITFSWSLPFLDVIQFPRYFFFHLSCPCHLCTYMLPSSRSIMSNLLARFSHFKIFWFESFSKMKVKVKLLSLVRLFATPWTVAYQVPPSMGFSRQEYWRGLPFPSAGDLPNAGFEPRSPALQADAFTLWANREAHSLHHFI